MKKIFLFVFFGLMVSNLAYAFDTKPDVNLEVSQVSSTSAYVKFIDSSSMKYSNIANPVEFFKRGIFKYGESEKVCIAIYPTPKECLPLEAISGTSSITLISLKPNTKYFVNLNINKNIQCIKAPCELIEWQSEQVIFETLKSNSTSTNSTSTNTGIDKKIKKDILYRTRSSDVITLQKLLINLGFLKTEVTGYFGIETLKAVKNYQRDVMHISPTGKVGPLTRDSLSK